MGKVIHSIACQTGYLLESVLVGIMVDHGVGEEVHSALGVDDVHSGEMLESVTYAHHLLGYVAG